MLILVEDDKSTREIMGEFLKSINKDFRIASTVDEGIALVKKFCPKILLTDMVLGDRTPEALIAYCKKHHPRLKSILYTATSRPRAELAAKTMGVDHLVMKPFDLDELELLLN